MVNIKKPMIFFIKQHGIIPQRRAMFELACLDIKNHDYETALQKLGNLSV
ncbi:MAG: hypothetical protein ACLR56_07865 [Oscillospiraceae bacterium]